MSCMDNNKFWQWFLENEDRFFSIEDDVTQDFNALFNELKKINESISVEFGPVGAPSVRIVAASP